MPSIDVDFVSRINDKLILNYLFIDKGKVIKFQKRHEIGQERFKTTTDFY